MNAPASSTSSSNALFIDEYTPSGVLVQSLPLPYVQANSYFFSGSIHINFIIFTKKNGCEWIADVIVFSLNYLFTFERASIAEVEMLGFASHSIHELPCNSKFTCLLVLFNS